MINYSGYPRRGGSGFMLIIYLIFAAYFINYAWGFVKIPAAIEPLNKWIFLIGGILIVIGAINHFRIGRYRNPY